MAFCQKTGGCLPPAALRAPPEDIGAEKTGKAGSSEGEELVQGADHEAVIFDLRQARDGGYGDDTHPGDADRDSAALDGVFLF